MRPTPITGLHRGLTMLVPWGDTSLCFGLDAPRDVRTAVPCFRTVIYHDESDAVAEKRMSLLVEHSESYLTPLLDLIDPHEHLAFPENVVVPWIPQFRMWATNIALVPHFPRTPALADRAFLPLTPAPGVTIRLGTRDLRSIPSGVHIFLADSASGKTALRKMLGFAEILIGEHDGDSGMLDPALLTAAASLAMLGGLGRITALDSFSLYSFERGGLTGEGGIARSLLLYLGALDLMAQTVDTALVIPVNLGIREDHPAYKSALAAMRGRVSSVWMLDSTTVVGHGTHDALRIKGTAFFNPWAREGMNFTCEGTLPPLPGADRLFS